MMPAASAGNGGRAPVWHIPHLVVRLRFSVRVPLALPPLFGSTFRGLLGAGLVALEKAAATPAVRTALSDLRRRLFEPAPRTGLAPFAGLARVPPPWRLLDVFDPHGCRLVPGDALGVRLVLVGDVADAAEPVIDALALAPRLHVAGVPGALALAGAEPMSGAVPVPKASRLRVILESPLRYRRNGQEVTPGRFDAFGFGAALVRRLGLLAAHYGGEPVDLHAALDACARTRLFGPDLVAWCSSRWSGRQQRRVPVKGLLGTFVLDTSDAPELQPALALGTRLGAGRAVTLGCGQFRLAETGRGSNHARRPDEASGGTADRVTD